MKENYVFLSGETGMLSQANLVWCVHEPGWPVMVCRAQSPQAFWSVGDVVLHCTAVLQKNMAALQERKLQEGQQLVKEAEKL